MVPPAPPCRAAWAFAPALLLAAGEALANDAQLICLAPFFVVGIVSELLAWVLWLLFPALCLGAFAAGRGSRHWLRARVGGYGLAVAGLLLGAASLALGLHGLGAQPMAGNPHWSHWGVCNYPNEHLKILAAVLWLPATGVFGFVTGLLWWTPRPLSARLTADPPGLARVLAAHRAATPPPPPAATAAPMAEASPAPGVEASAAALTSRLPIRAPATTVDTATRERIAAAARRLGNAGAMPGPGDPAP